MDDPPRDIEGVIRQLTQTPPSVQRNAILTYFTSDAEFIHPLCRTGSFNGSRFLIQAIYRWYKIMSPQIELDVKSVAYDAQTLTLYVHISQIFRIFIIPFYQAPVSLVTVLTLRQGSDNKHYIASQNDLYQVNQFVKFFTWPIGFLIVLAWQFLATLVCLGAAVTFWPISWIEESGARTSEESRTLKSDVQEVEDRLKQTLVNGKGDGELITAPVTGQ